MLRVACAALVALLLSAPAPAQTCVDINTASLAELQLIIHIGPDRAAEINQVLNQMETSCR